MIINCFCGMVDRRITFSLISSRDHCQRFSPSRISDRLRAGVEPAQNLSLGLVEWRCAAVITTTARRRSLITNICFDFQGWTTCSDMVSNKIPASTKYKFMRRDLGEHVVMNDASIFTIDRNFRIYNIWAF